MLQTNESWECSHRGQLLGAIFGDPGLRYYPFVEIPVNLVLFHVDIVLRDNHRENESWSRFIFDELADVLRFIKRDDVVQMRLSLQSRMCENDDYTISSIAEIAEGKNRAGHKRYVCICPSGKNYVDSFMGETESDLSDMRTTWSRSRSH